MRCMVVAVVIEIIMIKIRNFENVILIVNLLVDEKSLMIRIRIGIDYTLDHPNQYRLYVSVIRSMIVI